MKIGIVGAEGAKFTPAGETEARRMIRSLLTAPDVTAGVSGHCHLGGIDIWMEEEADHLRVQRIIYPPTDLTWSRGFMPRNISIARACDKLVCIVVDRYPPYYVGMRFAACYHCQTDAHIKSGGCWTGKFAASLGKPWETLVVANV